MSFALVKSIQCARHFFPLRMAGLQHAAVAQEREVKVSGGIPVLVALIALLPASTRAQPGEGATLPAIIGLDHIPVAVRNLDSAAHRYRELGFVLKPGRPHANGASIFLAPQTTHGIWLELNQPRVPLEK